MKLNTIGLAVLILFAGCDKIEGPYGNSTINNGGNNGDNAVRKVLIEDFTGHKCGNCPRAAEKLSQVHNLYGNQVISFAVHAGFFAKPENGYYATDFRTPTGDALNTFFGNSAAGLPNGLVNRKQFNGTAIVDYNAWPTRVGELLQTPPDAQIILEPQYNISTRTFKIDASIKVLQNIDEATNIIYYLSEDSIVGYQKDYSLTAPGDISQYYHRHVLKSAMNGTWGTELSSAALSQGETLQSTFTVAIPSDWNESKVSVIAVLYRKSNKEIIQVEEKKIKSN